MRAIIEAYFHERVGYHTLIRALIAHKTWIIPAQKQGEELHPSLFQHEGRTLLTAYSQKENAPDQLETITVDGLWLFDQLPDIIDALIIDPQSSHALQLPKTQFAQLKQWRDAVHIEQQLAQPTFDANVLEQLPYTSQRKAEGCNWSTLKYEARPPEKKQRDIFLDSSLHLMY